jgi:hypothetical protein
MAQRAIEVAVWPVEGDVDLLKGIRADEGSG